MENQKEIICFYEREFYPFSNFSSFMLEWKGTLYMTSEHAYHTEKFTDSEIIRKIKEARSVHDVFQISREYQDKVRPDWLDIRVSVMEEIIRAKVAQHPYVKQKLIESGGRKATSFFPDCIKESLLGKIWMKIRDDLLLNHNKGNV